MKRYRKKPIDIEAVQYNGQLDGYETICDWAYPTEITANDGDLLILSDAGRLRAKKGDWVIRVLDTGFFYPIKDTVFKEFYIE